MCVYVQGRVLGDIAEAHCSLFHAVKRIFEVSESFDQMWDQRFTGHTPEEVFSWLDAVLYSGDLIDPEDEAHKFNFLTNTGEQFDGFKSFVYCTPSGLVHVLIQDRTDLIFAPSCRSGEFRTIASQLRSWFENETS